MEKEEYFLVLGKANWLPKCSKFVRQFNYRIIVSSRFMNPRDFIRNLIAEETLYKKLLAVVLFRHPLIFLDNCFLQFEPTVPSLLSFWIWAFWGPQISSDPIDGKENRSSQKLQTAYRNYRSPLFPLMITSSGQSSIFLLCLLLVFISALQCS